MLLQLISSLGDRARPILGNVTDILGKMPVWALLPLALLSFIVSLFLGMLQGSVLAAETKESVRRRAWVRGILGLCAGICFLFGGDARGLSGAYPTVLLITLGVSLFSMIILLFRGRIWGLLELLFSIFSAVFLGSFCSGMNDKYAATVMFFIFIAVGWLLEWALCTAVTAAAPQETGNGDTEKEDTPEQAEKTEDRRDQRREKREKAKEEKAARKEEKASQKAARREERASQKPVKKPAGPGTATPKPVIFRNEEPQTAPPVRDPEKQETPEAEPVKTLRSSQQLASDLEVSRRELENILNLFEDKSFLSEFDPKDAPSGRDKDPAGKDKKETAAPAAEKKETKTAETPAPRTGEYSRKDQLSFEDDGGKKPASAAPAPAARPAAAKKQVKIPLPEVTLNVCTIGPHGSGKTTLTSAITQICAAYGGTAYSVKDLDTTPLEADGGMTIEPSFVEYMSLTRRYIHIDTPGRHTYYKNALRGINEADAAVLVVSFSDRPRRAREYLLMAANAGIKRLIVFINKCDTEEATQEEILLREKQYEDLISDAEVDFDYMRIISGSALGAVSGAKMSRWESTVREVISAMDGCSVPKFNIMLPFRMSIGKVYGIMGMGTVVTGRISEGRIKVGDPVTAVGYTGKDVSSAVEAIEILGRDVRSAKAGDCVGIRLRGLLPGDVSRGQVLCAPGTGETHLRIGAEFRYLFYSSADRTGRPKSLWNETKLQYWFGNTDVTGAFRMHEDDYFIPGDDFVAIIDFDKPVPIRDGDIFSARKGSQTVGFGRVVRTD